MSSQLKSSFHRVSNALSVSVSPNRARRRRVSTARKTLSSSGGTTGKDAQQYWCKACETYFNDLTHTLFGQHRFGLEEMFYIVKEMRSEPTAQIARDLDRDYEAVLNFVHKVQDVSGNIDEFDLYDVCEADEVYVTAGEKGLEDENGSPRERGLSKRDAEPSHQTNHQC